MMWDHAYDVMNEEHNQSLNPLLLESQTESEMTMLLKIAELCLTSLRDYVIPLLLITGT